MKFHHDAELKEIEAVVKKIHPLLSGRDPRIQGAILCDLFATWIQGFHAEGDDGVRATAELRGEMVASWLKAAADLTLAYDRRKERPN